MVHHDHVAILREPYLQEILDGKKTIESRFSRVKCPPYEVVSPGDTIYLKRTGGPIVATATAGLITFMHAMHGVIDIKEVAAKHPGIRARDDYINTKAESRYGTLIWLENVTKLPEPVAFPKKDRRAWVCMKTSFKSLETWTS